MKRKKAQLDIELLVENNQGLVYHLAMRIHRRLPVRQDLDDLIGYGMIGLLEAANKFQPNRGIEFTTFAYPRVNGAIYDGVSKMSWMSRSRYKRLMRERDLAESTGSAVPLSSAPIGEMINVSSLEAESVKSLVSDEEDNVETKVVRREEQKLLGELIEELPNRERRLITMIYIEDLSLQEAAERVGVSKSWASRMHHKTLTLLANEIKSRA